MTRDDDDDEVDGREEQERDGFTVTVLRFGVHLCNVNDVNNTGVRFQPYSEDCPPSRIFETGMRR